MIGIRSITYHLPTNYNDTELNKILNVSRFWPLQYPAIRTQRMALTPCNKPMSVEKIKKLSNICDTSEIRWFNIPIDPWESQNKEELFKFCENTLNNFGRAFINVLTFKNNKANDEIIEFSSNLLKKVSLINKNGKDNFRLGFSANIKPNGPFFPFTMSGGNLGFSIALELTQEINAICDRNNKLSIMQLRDILSKELIKQISDIEKIALHIAEHFNLLFLGFDFSIAPIISDDGSVITILHRLGIYNFGKNGTLFATVFLTDLIKSFKKKFRSVGFSGVMYSLLEDLELCMINNERGVTLEDLTKLSTMCGCGIDMVPVYGGITNQELKSIFLEIYSISSRLDKPLGIRILPIPYTKKNQLQYTNLHDDADFIANTKIVDLDINILPFQGEEYTLLNEYLINLE
ncbi:MAG: DUF711 family protein [Beduini sp.]|uniref:DUF711 family protein n=1 Tax=Beduini sp. TaxID=1922300 RepID=UPI0039A345B3